MSEKYSSNSNDSDVSWKTLSEIAAKGDNKVCTNENIDLQSQLIQLGFVQGAEWQRGQLNTDEIIEDAAKAMLKSDVEHDYASHQWGEFPETDEWYKRNAQAAIATILKLKE